MNLVDQLLGSGMLVRLSAFVPPILQHCALRKLLLEDLVGLLQRISKIGCRYRGLYPSAATAGFCFHSADRASGFPPISYEALRIPQAKLVHDPDHCSIQSLRARIPRRRSAWSPLPRQNAE